MTFREIMESKWRLSHRINIKSLGRKKYRFFFISSMSAPASVSGTNKIVANDSEVVAVVDRDALQLVISGMAPWRDALQGLDAFVDYHDNW